MGSFLKVINLFLIVFIKFKCKIKKCAFICFETGNDWLGYWGKHMKATCFKAVREYQKVRKSNKTILNGILDSFQNL